MIETGFGKEFSEPPNVTVSATRTHCEACKEPLDPNVMHKCHGNKEYEPPTRPAHPDLANYKGVCPKCHGGRGLIINVDTGKNPDCDMCGGTGVVK